MRSLQKIQIWRFTPVKNQNLIHPKAVNLATLHNATVQSTIMYNEAVSAMQSLVECTVLLSLMATVNSAASYSIRGQDESIK